MCIRDSLEGDQWQRLIARLGEIENPTVPTSPSRYAIPTDKGHDETSEKAGKRRRASSAHIGE